MKKLIVGTGKSGISLGKYLVKKGISFEFFDDKTKEDNLLDKPILKSIEDLQEYVGDFDEMIISPGVAIDSGIVKFGQKNGLSVIGEFEFSYQVSNKNLIGITGTNGKTTTTALIGHILKQVKKTEIVGNIGVPFIEKVDNNPDIFVAEISSFQLETIYSLKPHIAIILNITPDHLDRHYTLENYAHTKMRISENQSESDYLILNADCKTLSKYEIETKAKKLYFSVKNIVEGAYIQQDKIFVNDVYICNLSDVPLVGEHNLENVLASVLACYFYGISPEVICNGIKTFKAVKHRLQFVAELDGVKYFNDSKGTNPDAAIKAILSMNSPTYLIAGGYDKHSDYTEWLSIAKGKVKKLILMGETATKICEVAKKLDYAEEDILMVNNMKEAITYCKNNAKSGENVLLSPACASWGMYKNYEERGDDFISLVGE